MADFPQIDFSPIGDLANVYRQSRQQATRQQALSQLGQSGGPIDYETASKALIAAGDPMGLTLANLAQAASRDKRDFGFREQEARRAQTNADRSFGLQERTANEAARGFELREVDDPSTGGKRFVRVEKATGRAVDVPIEGAATTPNNPFQQGKMNESQSKDALYTSRMLKSEKVLRSIDADVATGWTEKARGAISDKIGFNVRSPEYQKFDQAQRDFINSTLRRESGAVISDSEFDNARKQYFPQPGDTPDLIAQKRANRMEAIKGIGAGAGPGYRPDSKFDDKGEIVPNPAAQARPPVPGARQGIDGNFYVSDPNRPGKFLKVNP